VAEVPNHVKRKLTFIYVQHMDDVLPRALLPAEEKPEKKTRRAPRKVSQENGTASDE
jgi:hypothetical protein